MPLVAVNFHYVGMPAFPHAGIHGLTEEDFRSAVTTLASRYELVSLAEVVRLAAMDGVVESDLCLITFDDGLRCQFDAALPILDELNAPAAFFVSAGPLRDRVASTIHKLHWARANFGDEAVAATIRDLAGDKTIALPQRDASIADKARDAYRYDSTDSALLKFTMNYMLSESDAQKVVNELFSKERTPDSDFIPNLYMSADAVREIGKRGSLGSHAVSHRPLAGMTVDAVETELRVSKEFLEDIAGCAVDVVSYPLGNMSAVSHEVGRVAGACGYRAGFTMERAVNATLGDPLLLARCDASDIGKIESFPPRSRYFDGSTLTSVRAT